MQARSDTLATLAAAALLGLFALWYAPLLGTGFITHTDEFATLDRSSSMLTTGDWATVHSRNLPSFKKPPLQYWMSAALMEAGVGLPTALRLPSLIFALAGLWAAGFLARTLLPASPWVAPAAILLCAGSLAYWTTGTSALLDSGSVFFATLALAATLRALAHPGWWYVVAAAVVLGAIQKAPIGLFLVLGYLVALALTRSAHSIDVRAIRRSPSFRRAVWIVVIGTLAWPILQIMRHSTVTVVEDLLGQTVGRFVPAGFDDDLTDFTGLSGMILGDEPLLRLLGIAALVWLPWRLRRMDLLPLPALFGLYVLLMYLAVGNVSGRYTVVFLPLLAASLAAVILSLPLPLLARAARRRCCLRLQPRPAQARRAPRPRSAPRAGRRHRRAPRRGGSAPSRGNARHLQLASRASSRRAWSPTSPPATARSRCPNAPRTSRRRGRTAPSPARSAASAPRRRPMNSPPPSRTSPASRKPMASRTGPLPPPDPAAPLARTAPVA